MKKFFRNFSGDLIFALSRDLPLEGQLYDTGVAAEYGDQLLTLSTCEYTYPNGRFVVVAKKV